MCFLLVPLLAAQSPPKPETVVTLRAQPAQLRLVPGGTATLKLQVEIIPGFHINSEKPLQSYLIPTEVFLPAAPNGPSEFELVGAKFPKAELKTFDFAPDEKLAVYEGTIEVALTLRARPETKPGSRKLALGVRYQACNDEICLRPAERQLTLTVQLQATAARKPRH